MRHTATIFFIVLAIVVSSSVLFYSRDAHADITERVSVASDGTEGNDRSRYNAISADGRFVAFDSDADNLVEGDTNEYKDVFVHDRQTGQTTRVSVASDGTQGDNYAEEPSISADGRLVAFQSPATNLAPGDTNGHTNVFVHDRQTGQTTRVSVASDGTAANGYAHIPSISADGRFVTFYSYADNLVEGDTNGVRDVFVHDRQTGQTTRASVASDGTQGNSASTYPSISADGRFVAFQSSASFLVEGDTNLDADVFVRDRQAGLTTRISVASDGTEGSYHSYRPSISADGRVVAFLSRARNLVADDTNGIRDIFVHDRQTAQTTRVSVSSDGTQATGGSYNPAISADGRFVVFYSEAGDLVADDTNGIRDVFIHDRQTAQTTLVSVSSDGVQGNGGSQELSINADGRFVAFQSSADNLVEGDTNGIRDIFIRDRGVMRLTVVTISGDRPGSTNYIAVHDYQEVVNLCAPESIVVADTEHAFYRWTVDGIGRPRGQNCIDVTMDAHRVAVAEYPREWYVDDDAPSDPGPGDPAVSDPLEDGSADRPFDSIQEAVDAASDVHTIVVRDGTYTGDGNRDINVDGKRLQIVSERGPARCMIDCEQQARAFSIHGGAADTLISGFTIVNGQADKGGAIYCTDAPAIITRNVIRNCQAVWRGGAIACFGASAVIEGNWISECKSYFGGGIYCENAPSPEITGNIITGNSANTAGGIASGNSGLNARNNTIVGNRGAEYGGGIALWGTVPSQIVSCILYGNESSNGPQVALTAIAGPCTATVGYSSVAGGAGAVYVAEGCSLTYTESNIEAAPQLADPGHWNDNGTPDNAADDSWIAGDYHLKSQYGRWDPAGNEGAGGWVVDDMTSPCIDTGDPASDFANEPEPNGGRINMGAYSNTAEASKTYVPPPTHTLTVQSTPITGVSITGDKPGTTDYTATSEEGSTVSLTAPATVTVESVRYEFVRWQGHPAGQTTIELTMNASRTATAVYAATGIVYVEGPNERGEGPLPPATGMTPETLGLFFVDVYAEDMPGFMGFQATLEFLDDEMANAADSSIFMAYHHIPPGGGASWGDRQITWNEEFLPVIMEVVSGDTFGLLSMKIEYAGFPPVAVGYVDKTITEKTWLMTVGYWYMPGAEGDGTQVYTIGIDPARTIFGTQDAEMIPFSVVTGGVTIGGAITHDLTVQSTPITGVNITGGKPGTTNYTGTYDDQEVVSLTAPATVTVESVRYNFVLWDGHPDGQATITFTMDANVTVSAVYVAALQRLIIEGPDQRGEGLTMMGEGTVTVGVYAEGITGFAAVQTVLQFTDPLGADDGFLISTTDGNPEFGGQAIVYNEALFGSIFPIFIGDAGRPFYRETAGFMMSSGSADLPGKTWLMSITYDCNVSYDSVGTHTITANELVTVLAGTGGGIPYEVVPGSATFVAWPIPGDANLDCVINIIDMLVIRDKLGADVSTGDNWRADVNEDGAIDILDLIFVRGKLHDACAQFACVTTQLDDFTISSNPVSIMIGDSRSVIDHGDTVDVYLDGALLRGRVPVAPLTPITGVEMAPGDHTLRIDYASGGADKCIEAIVMIIPADALAVTEIQEITIGAGGSSACTIRRE